MAHHPLIKVIKRDEREQVTRAVVEDTSHGLSSQEKSRSLAVTVAGWIDESRQARLTEHQEIKQRLGWPAIPGSN
jgi:hypothetical protein